MGHDKDHISSQTRKIVVPGELLDAKGGSGLGTSKKGGKIYSNYLGFLKIKHGEVSVMPLNGKYLPSVGDLVVGICVTYTDKLWFVDINSSSNVLLLAGDVPWEVPNGKLGEYIEVGAVMMLKVKEVDQKGDVLLTMKGNGLKKVKNGDILSISAVKVPRLIGKGGSMIKTIKDRTRCRVVVGKNGYIWVDGRGEDILLAKNAIRIVEERAQRSGLTTYVDQYLKKRSEKSMKG